MENFAKPRRYKKRKEQKRETGPHRHVFQQGVGYGDGHINKSFIAASYPKKQQWMHSRHYVFGKTDINMNKQKDRKWQEKTDGKTAV